MRVSLKPVRQRTSAGHPRDLLIVLFLIALFVAIISIPVVSRAGASEGQPAQVTGETAQGKVQPQSDAEGQNGLEEKWGIQVIAVRLSAAGRLVDFRYHIVDAEKAKPIVNRQEHPYILDQASGTKLGVPDSSLGSVRTTTNPIAGRNYFIIFENAKRTIKPGSKVTIVIGELRVEDITVQK